MNFLKVAAISVYTPKGVYSFDAHEAFNVGDAVTIHDGTGELLKTQCSENKTGTVVAVKGARVAVLIG